MDISYVFSNVRARIGLTFLFVLVVSKIKLCTFSNAL